MELFVAGWLIVSVITNLPFGNIFLTTAPTDRATCEQVIEEQKADVAEYVKEQLPDGTQFELIGHCDPVSAET